MVAPGREEWGCGKDCWIGENTNEDVDSRGQRMRGGGKAIGCDKEPRAVAPDRIEYDTIVRRTGDRALHFRNDPMVRRVGIKNKQDRRPLTWRADRTHSNIRA